MYTILEQNITLNHSGTLTPYRLYFSVPEQIQQLQLFCRSQLPDFNEDKIKLLYQQYIQHAAINEFMRVQHWPKFFNSIKHIHKHALVVHFYDPKSQYRGHWNSHWNEAKIIGDHYADAGLVAGDIHQGEWQAVLIIPSTYGDLNFYIKIEISEENVEHKAPETYLPVPTPPVTVESEHLWYIGELHETTSRSAGKKEAEELLPDYEYYGYNFVVFIDKDTQPLSGIATTTNISVYSGQEIETPYGKMLLIGIRNFIVPYSYKTFLPLEQIIRETHMQGGLVIASQPYAVSSDGRFPAGKINQTDWHHVDLLEVWPGLWQDNFPEILHTLDLWDTLLNKEIKIFAVCGKGNQTELNDNTESQIPKLIVQCDGLSETSLLTALKLGHSYITCEPAVAIWVESSNGIAQMGDEMTTGVSMPFLLQFRCNQMDRCFIRIKHNNGILLEMPLQSQTDTQQQITLRAKPGLEWFRAEIYRYGRHIDELLAITNPVFVRGMLSL